MMKNRRLILFLVLAVVVSAMAVLLKYRHTVFHTQKENIFIEHYEGNSGIVPSFISNMRINDTLAIDATILQAVDSASWCLLRTEFRVRDLDSTNVEKIKNDKDVFNFRIMEFYYPTFMEEDTLYKNYMVYISHLNHTITIFHLERPEDGNGIIDKAVDEIKKKQI